jgi:serine/threonine protein kinase
VIQVGQVLDKYELLERVGQGGMAIVYRGIDRSLKRVVAIKVLHKHLSDYQEARDRFEREAQAVAKLRHDNILEIFDYAAKPDSEAYIVTEFIDGATLKQVITDRPIAFPEIGAMLILQVGRALAHAHSAGILHRDVKPENIMIRSDGVVKLMDFGISHMIDLERLTVTGQLLGSPAYMAPEHVEGRPLDYRTDVFAAGIVLYQLCVGRLPFEGKNPHEVLKRIAECRFVDPRTANPRIGNRLGRIILRAMAALPSGRYPAIGEMVTALENYLEESGLPHEKTKVASELARYFDGPASYEQALEERLIDHLTRRGQKLLDEDDRSGALDVFDRVLTIDSDNEKVIAILDGINRRLRMRAVGLAVLAAAAVGSGAWAIHRKTRPPGLESPGEPDFKHSIANRMPITNVTPDDEAPPEVDAAVAILEPDGGTNTGGSGFHAVIPPAPDANPTTAGQPIRVTVTPINGAEVSFGDGKWIPVTPEDGALIHLIDHELTIKVRNESCCVMQEMVVRPGQTQASFDLKFKNGFVIATCSLPGMSASIKGTPITLGQAATVFFEGTLLEQKSVTIDFIGQKVVTKTVLVTPGKTVEVACE